MMTTHDIPVSKANPTPHRISRISVLPVKPNPRAIKPLTSSPSTPPGNCGNCAFSEYRRRDSNALLAVMRTRKPMQATAMERRSLSVATSMRR